MFKKNILFACLYENRKTIFAPRLTVKSFRNDSVAQLVEQYTFNVWALGSSPSGITNKCKAKALYEGLLIFKKSAQACLEADL